MMPKLARLFFSLLLAYGIFSLVGCASLKGAGGRRGLVMESSWVRSTTKQEFLGFRRMNRMSPIVLEKMVVQANAIDGIVAYDLKSGSELWRVDLKNGVEGGAQVVGEKLYFGSSDGQFYCASITNGKIIWSIPVRAETLAPPTVDNGVVYFESGADIVFAVDAETGKQLWLYNRQVTGSLSIRATTRPVVAGEKVLAGFSDGFIAALRKRDGGLIWERKLGRGNRFKDVDATPVVDGANIYVASFDAALYSLNLETGEVNWTVDEGGYVPVTAGQGQFADRLFYATAGGKVLSVDKRSGKILTTISGIRGIATQPALYKGFLVYGESDGGLVVADALSGNLMSRFESGYGLVSKPTVRESSGEVFFISNGANLFNVKIRFQRSSDLLPWQTAL